MAFLVCFEIRSRFKSLAEQAFCLRTLANSKRLLGEQTGTVVLVFMLVFLTYQQKLVFFFCHRPDGDELSEQLAIASCIRRHSSVRFTHYRGRVDCKDILIIWYQKIFHHARESVRGSQQKKNTVLSQTFNLLILKYNRL